MLLTRKRLHSRKTRKSKIDPSVAVCSDELMLLDLLEQFIGVWCCSMLTYAYEDSNDVITAATTGAAATTVKTPAIQRKGENHLLDQN